MPIFTLQLGSITISPTWYGLMYVCSFVICYVFMKKYINWKGSDHLDTLVFWSFLGVLFGGRLGYVLLYNPTLFIHNPLEIIAVWKGGMSFHGGFLGICTAFILFAKKHKYSFWYLIDHLAVIIPVALGLGRLGNWINQELPGFAPYYGPFAMNINGIPHFPSPLLQILGEGIILACIMIFVFRYTKLPITPGRLSGVFLIGYSMARLVAEQFRLPDAHIGYLFGTNFLTLGILYTLPMLVFGIYLVMRKRI